MKKLILLGGLLGGVLLATLTPVQASADGKTCSPKCKKNETCYCTFNNGSMCDDDHPVLGRCSCRCA